MNVCILLAEITQSPQIRYTSDNQTPIAEMIVQFHTPRDNDPPGLLKVTAWNRLATEVEQRHYQPGDRVIIEGRLSMVTIDRQEGFREKRAELRAQKIFPLRDLTLNPSSGAMNAAPMSAPMSPPMNPANYAPVNPYAAPVAPPSNVTPFPSPQGMPQSMPQGMPQAVPQAMPQATPQAVPQPPSIPAAPMPNNYPSYPTSDPAPNNYDEDDIPF